MNGKFLAVSNKVITLIIFVLVCFYAESQTTYFVKTDGTSAEEAAVATSWATACSDLQAVINTADSGDQIWVKQGTYKPCRPANNLTTIDSTNRDNSFVLKAGVKIYGSFEGTETTLAERPQWAQYPFTDAETNGYESILSGDLLGDDEDNFVNYDENVYHVLIGVDIPNDSTTVIDGFVITGGNAVNGYSIFLYGPNIEINGSIIYQSVGSGIYNKTSSLIISNIIVNKNMAECGAGMYNFESNIILINVTINENSTSTEDNNLGAGIFNDFSEGILTDVVISYNNGLIGGGMFNYASHPMLSNVTIINNTGGGMTNHVSSPILTDVIISKNNGGGMLNNYLSSPKLTNIIISENTVCAISNVMSSPKLTNVTIYGNISDDNYSVMRNYESSPVLQNTIIYGNEGNLNNNFNSICTYKHSLVQGEIGGLDGNVNGNIDPLFTDPENGDYSLQPTSPCINVGNNGLYLSARNISDFTNELDLAGNPRLYGTNIDMGAYENNNNTINVPNLLSNNIRLFPNPAGETLNIAGLQGSESLQIIDINGKILKNINTNTENLSIAVNNLSTGIYFVKVNNKNSVKTLKFVKH